MGRCCVRLLRTVIGNLILNHDLLIQSIYEKENSNSLQSFLLLVNGKQCWADNLHFWLSGLFSGQSRSVPDRAISRTINRRSPLVILGYPAAMTPLLHAVISPMGDVRI
jgi:hypothetical protein